LTILAGSNTGQTEKARFVEDLSEKEQLEVMRTWWRDNGRYVIGGVVLGVALLAGWNYWQSVKRTAELEASALYETLLENVASGNVEPAESTAASLYQKYGSTPYAAQARLALARLYMDKGRDQDAADVLRALLDSRGDEQLKPVARLRLARVLLYQEKAAEAVELLSGQPDSAFSARFSEVLGDAYVALGRFDEAGEAYAVAISDDPTKLTVDRILVQMKINDLPEPGEVVAVDESLQTPSEQTVEAPDPGEDEDTQ
jgi:predicted negative regulator of RcsB-dependent stress response